MTTDVSIVAFGAVDAWGSGQKAVRSSFPEGQRRVVIARHERFAARGLTEPFLAAASSLPWGQDRATSLLLCALTECLGELDRVRPAWRRQRVGLVIGTSAGAMDVFETLCEGTSARVEDATYAAPLRTALRALGLTVSPVSLILGACASSAFALGIARAWLADDRCDLVLAGGFDGESFFVATGFSALRALDPRGMPQPFDAARRGLALGEGAAVAALAWSHEATPFGSISGFGATLDASSLVAPDPDGLGLVRACHLALGTRLPKLVSAHATATERNDAAEAKALETLGIATLPRDTMKAEIGHTLGASSVLEALALVDAVQRTGVTPGLKLSAAFGGANAALLIDAPSPPRGLRVQPVRTVAYVGERVHVAVIPGAVELRCLRPLAGFSDVRLERADSVVRLGLGAVAELASRVGVEVLRGAGIVVGHGLATFEVNAAFYAEVVARGARAAEPRKFPYTSPNAVVGECAAALGLTGPGYAVGMAGGLEALLHAVSWIRAGMATRVVVLGLDAEGAAAERYGVSRIATDYPPVGAVALLVTSEREPGGLAIDAVDVCAMGGLVLPVVPRGLGHGPLLPLVAGGGNPRELRLESAGIVANVRFSV